jgi:hypothetical protein
MPNIFFCFYRDEIWNNRRNGKVLSKRVADAAYQARCPDLPSLSI